MNNSKRFCKQFFNIEHSEIGDVVLFSCFDRSREVMRAYKSNLACEFSGAYKGFNLDFNKKRLTVVITGPGSSRVGDAVLALQDTRCRVVLYSGAAGGISENIRVGDLAVPSSAIIGDGFSRYHTNIFEKDILSNYSQCSEDLIQKFKNYIGEEANFSVHSGEIFTTESLFSETEEFLTHLKRSNISFIDMETSAFFTAAKKIDVKSMAIHYVSDLPGRGDLPNIFNKECKKIYIKLPYILIDFIKAGLLNEL